MAAGWVRNLAQDRVDVYSGGSNPGKRYEDWALEDPAGLGVDAVRPIRDQIRHRVVELLNDLGIETK